MKPIQLPTQEYLKECFEYEDGHLFWRERPATHFHNYRNYTYFNTRFAGAKAGSKDKRTGYTYIAINEVRYLTHRIVYKIHTGVDPNIIDHINRIRTDNRFENLRSGTQADNIRNSISCIKNKSGHLNIHETVDGWRVRDRINGKLVHVGTYLTLEEAIQAKKEWDEA